MYSGTTLQLNIQYYPPVENTTTFQHNYYFMPAVLGSFQDLSKQSSKSSFFFKSSNWLFEDN